MLKKLIGTVKYEDTSNSLNFSLLSFLSAFFFLLSSFSSIFYIKIEAPRKVKIEKKENITKEAKKNIKSSRV
jgi:hypothetical protein